MGKRLAFVSLLVLAALVVLPAVAAVAQYAQVGNPQGNSTIGAPVAAGPDRQVLSQLTAIARRMNERTWGPAVVETFDKPGSEKEWTVSSGVMEVKDGGLVVSRVDQICLIKRPLPAALRNAEGFRIELKVSVERLGGIVNASLFIGPDDAQVNQWDCQYGFAAGGNGRIQRFAGREGIAANAALDAWPFQNVNTVVLQQVGRTITGLREKDKPISYVALVPVRVDEHIVVGLMGMCKSLRLERISMQPLVGGAKPEELAGMWKQTPFAGQAELTAYLRKNVIPQLQDKVFAKRQAASEALEALLPLSKPAAEETLKGGGGTLLADEARARLESIATAPDSLFVKDAASSASQPDTDGLPPHPRRRPGGPNAP
jgi:hypothetical protein